MVTSCIRWAVSLSMTAFATIILSVARAQADDAFPPDADAVRAGIADTIGRLSHVGAEKSLDTGEFMVWVYRLAHGRDPEPWKYAVMSRLARNHRLEAEAIVSLVIRGDAPGPTWEQCRRFTERCREKGLVPDNAVRESARRLEAAAVAQIRQVLAEREESAVPQSEKTEPPADSPVEPEVFGIWFGYFHDHSELSLDAEGDPYEAYRHARDVAGLDFYSLTDHGEFLLLWPWDNKWAILRDAADAAYQPGRFAAMWGFEWSNPVLGHITVINSSRFCSTLAPFWLDDFYLWLQRDPDAFAHFNHPGDFNDFGAEFLHFHRYPDAIRQMVGLELWNKSNSFDRFHYGGSWKSDLGYYDYGNLQGWRMGPLGGQDNHRRNWGLRNRFRIGILARELTREGAREAFLARRFYATEDENLHLDFRASGHPMGARLARRPRRFHLYAYDGGGDAFEQIRLFRNGKEILSRAVIGNPVDMEFEDTEGKNDDYYYVIVTQSDDNDGNGRNDEAISSPIWFLDAPPSAGCIASCLGGNIQTFENLLLLIGVMPALFIARARFRG